MAQFPTVTNDMDHETFRSHAQQVVEWMAHYLANVGKYPVLAQVHPGDMRRSLQGPPPVSPEPMEHILADVDHLLLPGITHWNSPGFMGYFGAPANRNGMLGDMIASTLNVNAMLWRTGTSATELEQVTLDWFRQLLGLAAARQAGDSRLQLTAASVPRPGQRSTLTITSPTLGGQLHLVGAALFPADPAPGSAARQGRQIPLALWREAPGVYDLNVRPLVPGREQPGQATAPSRCRWSIRLSRLPGFRCERGAAHTCIACLREPLYTTGAVGSRDYLPAPESGRR